MSLAADLDAMLDVARHAADVIERVYATDFAETLAARVLRAEHLLLPRVVQAVAAGHVHLAPDASVVGAFADGPADAVFTLSPS